MNNETAAKILAIITAVDNRSVDLTTVQAWADALDGLDPDMCVQAVRDHRKNSTDYLTPAHIVVRVRQMIQDEKSFPVYKAIEAPRADPDSHALREVKRIADQLADQNRGPSPHPKIENVNTAKTVPCKPCGAESGMGCTNRGNGRPLRGYHHTRLVAAGLAEREAPFDPDAFAKILANYPQPAPVQMPDGA